MPNTWSDELFRIGIIIEEIGVVGAEFLSGRGEQYDDVITQVETFIILESIEGI